MDKLIKFNIVDTHTHTSERGGKTTLFSLFSWRKRGEDCLGLTLLGGVL